MMAEFKWISLFLTAVLQFPAAETLPLYFAVRAGDEVTLPCEHVIGGQRKCEYTTWSCVRSGYRTVELIKDGQISEKAKSKSDRLRVTENCSLVIKKVTDEDVVCRYDCRQYKQGQQQASDSLVYLSVVTMTEQKYDDKVTLYCSVSKHEHHCRHTVKWLYEGKDVDKQNKDMRTWLGDCYTTVSFLDSLSYKLKSNLTCEVTDFFFTKVQLFTFSPQSSGEKTGETTTTTTTTTAAMTENTKSVTATTTNDPPTEGQWLIIASVGVAALLITVLIVVGLIRWKKTKGKKPQMDENAGRSLNPAVSPETSQDTADPEDGVSYASISYTRKTNSKGRVLGKDGDDEDDAVTYSTVKASSAGASADPSDLYATIR